MVKVSLLGACGGVGQPLALLLKTNPYITKLSLYDVQDSSGLGKDLSHINTSSKVESFDSNELTNALTGSQIVVIPAGMARKEGMTRDDLFKVNATIMQNLISAVSKTCPNARILIISNPVNCLVPVAVETLKKDGHFQARNVMGITTLDIIRSETFLRDILSKDFDPKNRISVIGGHSGNTIVPVLLDKKLNKIINKANYDALIHRIQFGGDEIIKAKKGKGSATFSMAYAGYQFVNEILESMCNNQYKPARLVPTYVYLPDIKYGSTISDKLGVEYMALPVKLKDGRVAEIDYSILNNLTAEEKKLLAVALKGINENITKGTNFVTRSSKL